MSCCSSTNTDRETCSPSACPVCKQPGQPIDSITPRHTLRTQFRSDLHERSEYFFCENPQCDCVYFNSIDAQHFITEQLINRVTCKDPSKETPLCYCFKITKGDVINEHQISGNSSVLKQIEEKMAERPCFCNKSNPRGLCCIEEITVWMQSQGIEQANA
ncbi:MAG: hypothetical protein OEL79_10995 [Chromatiales bacterium]|nr:hypothetical protein [Chromatiales bacterium]